MIFLAQKVFNSDNRYFIGHEILGFYDDDELESIIRHFITDDPLQSGNILVYGKVKKGNIEYKDLVKFVPDVGENVSFMDSLAYYSIGKVIKCLKKYVVLECTNYDKLQKIAYSRLINYN
jgi:hypothetical protein